jgi:hypothetical protein
MSTNKTTTTVIKEREKKMETGKLFNAFYEWIDEKDYTINELSELYNEAIPVDTSLINDRFSWLYDRKLDLNLLDREHKIELFREFLEETTKINDWEKTLADITRRGKKTTDAKVKQNLRESYKYFRDTIKELLAPVAEMEKEIDFQYKEEEEVVEDHILTDGEELLNYIEYHIDVMSHVELQDYLEWLQIYYEGKEIGFYHLVRSSVAILYRLRGLDSYDCIKISATGKRYFSKEKTGYLEEFNRMMELWQKFEMSTRKVNLELENIGTSYDLDAMIDLKRKAEKLAARHDVDAEEVFYMLLGEANSVEDYYAENMPEVE